MTRKFTFLILALFALIASPGWGQNNENYVKVTSASDLTDGTYLIVNETSNRAFNGLDAASDYVDVVISDNKIADANGAAIVEIKAINSGYSLKITNGDKAGFYIYGKSGNNSIQYGAEAVANEITFTDGAATILSNSTSFRYNAASGNDRFRYYKTSTTGASYIVPALYKKETTPAPTLESISIKTPPTKTTYNAGETFNPAGLVITATYDEGDPEDIAYADNESDFTFNPTLETALTTANTNVIITYGGKSCNQDITVNAGGGGGTTTDILNIGLTGITSGTTSYSDWNGKTSNSSAVYAGNSAGGNSSIQLRSTSTSGIITTTSGGKVTKVKVTWNDNTASGRTLDIYGKSTAYTDPSDLYSTDKQGTKLGSIVKGTSTVLNISGDYEYIGLRSKSGAMYIDEIQIDWASQEQKSVTVSTVEHGTIKAGSITEGNSGNVNVGSTVNLTATPDAGYVFTSWTITGATAADAFASQTSFTMPNENVTVSATFTAKPTFAVNFSEIENGTITANPSSAYEGQEVALTVTPNDGYAINTVTVTENETLRQIELSNDYKFTMPGNSVTVTASFVNVSSIYIVTFNAGTGVCETQSLTEATFGAGVVLPSASPSRFCQVEGYTFAGWAAAAVDETTTEPTLFGSGTTYYPTESCTLYAVYQITDGSSATSASYVKVTSSLSDWTGDYLIVYENSNGNVAFNGGLETLDDVSNTISVTINNGAIASSEQIDCAKFTIAKADNSSYSIKSYSGYYIGKSNTSNGLDSNTSWSDSYKNTISYSEGITIKGSTNMYLKYNSASNQNRFRYYGSGQQSIQLYKYTVVGGTTTYNSNPGCAMPTFENIAAFKAAAPSTECKITGNVTFVFRNGRNIYIQDETAALLVLDKSDPVITKEYTNGMTISDGIIGTYTTYNGQVEFIPTEDWAEGTVGNAVEPIVINRLYNGNYTNYDARLVKIIDASSDESSNVSYTSGTIGDNTSMYYFYDDDNYDEFLLRNNFKTLNGTINTEDWYNIIGFASIYNNNIQILPRSNSDIEVSLYNDIEEDKNIEFSAAVDENSGCTIKNGATVTVACNLTCSDPDMLLIEDGGQLITSNTGVKATILKDIAAHGTTDGWNFIASPIIETLDPISDMVGMIPEELEGFDLYTFDQAKDLEWQNYWEHDFDIANGQGYLYANADNTTLEFAGTLYNGNGEINLTFADKDNLDNTPYWQGWNLVGNPFTFKAYPSLPYYAMNAEGTAISAKTPNGQIDPCTSVFVQATTTDQKVTFSKDAPVRSGSLEISLAQANTRNASRIDNAIVSFGEGQQLEKLYMFGDGSSLYIPQGDKEYAIVSAATEGTLPLCFVANKNGQYTLSVNTENVKAEYLHLIDNLTGADTDLLVSNSYTFSAKTSDYASRFKLVFKATVEDEEVSANATFAYINNGDIIVSNEGRATLNVIDMMGRVISSQSINGDCRISTNGLTAGVYVLSLNGMTQKIVVR